MHSISTHKSDTHAIEVHDSEAKERSGQLSLDGREITPEFVCEIAEKIENAIYNICIFLGKDCEEQAFVKFANSFSERIVNHHTETGLERIIEVYSSTVSNVVLPGMSGLVGNTLNEHLINNPITAEISEVSSPFLKTVSGILSIALRTVFRPLVRHMGQISAEIYADKMIAGKLSRLIREKLLHLSNKKTPEIHKKPVLSNEVRRVASICHLPSLLQSLNEIAESRFQLKNISEKKHRSITLGVIYGIESGIIKTVVKIDQLALWIPGEDKNVLDYIHAEDDLFDLRPVC
jgi:hypothetical protein